MVEEALIGDRAFQAAIEALLVKATGRALGKEQRGSRNNQSDDDEVAATLQAIIDKDLPGDRPPPTPTPGPVQEMSTESIVPENAPVFAEDEDADERSSGRSEDRSELDRRRQRAAELAAWRR
jgi:hypothetical protein